MGIFLVPGGDGGRPIFFFTACMSRINVLRKSLIGKTDMKYAAILFVAALLSACAPRYTAPSQAEIEAADAGEFPADYQDLIPRYMAASLIDPYSAQYTFTAPQKGWIPPRWGEDPPAVRFGWWVFGSVNAKNSFGGYVGARACRWFLRDGMVWMYASSCAN